MAPLMLFATQVFGQAQGSGKAQGPLAGMGILPMLLIMFGIIYFLMIRPEQKKQKARMKLLEAIKKNDKVITTSGMFGTVTNVKDTTVMIKIADNTVVEFSKSAVATIVNTDGSEKTPEKAA